MKPGCPLGPWYQLETKQPAQGKSRQDADNPQLERIRFVPLFFATDLTNTKALTILSGKLGVCTTMKNSAKEVKG